MFMFVGTYTRDTSSEGIYSFNVDAACKVFTEIACVAADNPSYLTAHPELPVLYGVSEIHDGAVNAYRGTDDGRLSVLGSSRTSTGDDPCHLSMTAGYVVVSNYSSGNLCTLPIAANGELQDFVSSVQHHGKGVDPMRQKSSHVHSSRVIDGVVYVADLGTDQVVSYPLDDSGRIDTMARKVLRLKPGAGPRLMESTSDGRYLYVINELDNTILAIAFDDEPLQIGTYSTLPREYLDASYCSHIQLSADDRFLYGSNRGHDSIVVFEIQSDGELRLLQHVSSEGQHPRHFSLTPDGNHLVVANKDSDNLVVLERDPVTGMLVDTGNRVSVPSPTCVVFR
jgi:6-phosphogluconolactonase